MFSPTNYLIYHPRPQKEEAYGREWQKTEEFRRDEETSKADLREGIEEGIREELRSSHKESLEGVVKGEVAREEGASEEEVRGLSDYFREVSDEVTAEWEHRISIEDHLGGRVTIIPTEKLCVQLY